MLGHQARLSRTTVKNALGAVCLDESVVDWKVEGEVFWQKTNRSDTWLEEVLWEL
jgi:hypothetical protein